MTANTAPTFSGTLDNILTIAEGAGFNTLDSTVSISDLELDAAGNYSGASVTIRRDGTASSDDSFTLAGLFQPAVEGGLIALNSSSSSPGLIIGTVQKNSGGIF